MDGSWIWGVERAGIYKSGIGRIYRSMLGVVSRVWRLRDLADGVIDVAAGSIEDFRLRLRDKRRKYPVELFVLDCFRVSVDISPRDCC
jgi:hypothetical protein